MVRETIRRRRPSQSAGSSSNPSTTTELLSSTPSATDSTAQLPENTNQGKSIPELLDEEDKSFSQFLSLVGVAILVFLYMIRSTVIPPPGRVMAVVIDAGSTGTRAQVFHFHHDNSQGQLLLNRTQMFKHKFTIAALGLGTSSSSPYRFFRPLLDNVKKAVVGVRRRKYTPIILRATAGLRLLGPDAADIALQKSREALNGTEFLFQEDYVSIINDADEANYAWISVNYLLGNFHGEKTTTDLVGALDLGGASMQIVYQLPSDATAEVPSEERQKVRVFKKDYTLHSRSFLGLGLFDFTKKLYSLFESEGVLEDGNPCFRKDKRFVDKMLRMGVAGADTKRRVTIVGDGNFDRCVASAEIVIASSNKFETGTKALPPKSTFYAFAFFYDRVVKMGLSTTPSKEDFVKKGKELCETVPAQAVKHDFDEACAEFSFVFAVMKMLTEDFSKERDVRIKFEQYVDGHMLGWALAAALDVVEPVMHSQLALDDAPLTMS